MAAIMKSPIDQSRQILTIEMEEPVIDAIRAVIRAHDDEFDAALAPFGLSHMDILVPDWKRPARQADLDSVETLEMPSPSRQDHPEESCLTCGHDSDCATHNEPAMPAGRCNCSKSV